MMGAMDVAARLPLEQQKNEQINTRGPTVSRADPSTFSTGEQLLAIICFVYCGWVLALTCRAWWADGGGQTLKGSPRRQLLFWISCVAILLLVPSVMLQHLSPRIKG